MKRVADIIPTTEIENWNRGDNVCITAGTGVGKSYFIKTKLVEHCRKTDKRILFLVHRSILKEQIEVEIGEMGIGDVFKVETYQYVETLKRETDSRLALEYFDYIVADEFHYFLTDATFNNSTEVSLKEILRANTVRIFMSATPNDINKYFIDFRRMEIKEYRIEPKYDFIRSLTFIYGVDRVKEATYKTIERGKKTIIFTTSGRRYMNSLIQEFPSNIVYSSKSNDGLYVSVDEKKIEKMIDERKFNEEVLITTTAMEAGVSLFDKDIETIIIDVREVSNIVQCLGRKRQVDENDLVDLYIVVPSHKKLSDDKLKREAILGGIECLEVKGQKSYANTYHLNNRYNARLRKIIELVEFPNGYLKFVCNNLAKFKLELEVEQTKEYEDYETLDKGFIAYMERLFDMPSTTLDALDQSYTKKWRENYNKNRNISRADIRKETEEKRIKLSEDNLANKEETKELYRTFKAYLKKKNNKTLTDSERGIFYKELSELACTNIQTLPKANNELERLNIPFRLKWSEKRVEGRRARYIKVLKA